MEFVGVISKSVFGSVYAKIQKLRQGPAQLYTQKSRNSSRLLFCSVYAKSRDPGRFLPGSVYAKSRNSSRFLFCSVYAKIQELEQSSVL